MPELKVERLHLRNHRAIRALDLPEDGLGWGGVFPDTVVVAGGNGSGKTTLLHWIVTAFRGLFQGVEAALPEEGLLKVVLSGAEPKRFYYLAGPEHYAMPLYNRDRFHSAITCESVTLGATEFWNNLQGARVLFAPSPRDLILPSTERKSAGLVPQSNNFIHIWSAPREWGQSVEALLYEARWLDLNAKEEGRPEEAVHFRGYADAFSALLPGRTLVWRKGELVVRVENTDVTHPLSAMSSGEKQILLLLAELLRHWTPGSIVLIDEPELHLHTSLQLRLYDALQRFRHERGGQLWLATQSTELFGHAKEGTSVLLGAGSLR